MSDRRDDAFERALDEARRTDRVLKDDGPGPTRGPRMRAGVAFARAPGSGGEERFGLALGWTDEPLDAPAREAEAPACAPAGPPVETPGEIAAELGLDAPLTPAELASRWRDFVWRNHPDRQPFEARERANARMAIANALHEGARRKRLPTA